jgi:lipoprotein Spr
MLKNFLLYSFLICLLASCASLKTAFNGNKQSPLAEASTSEKSPKFLNQETAVASPAFSNKETSKKQEAINPDELKSPANESSLNKPYAEIQYKYAGLLNTEAGEVRNIPMYEFIDGWYGTPYKLGGTTKKGIDCSAFTQYLFAAIYTINLPRTAKEQYKLTTRISRTELKEGDLLFFNTRGGVSHVGVYLQNNKFVHASASGGVTISDVFDPYWVKRFIGVGRLNNSVASGN